MKKNMDQKVTARQDFVVLVSVTNANPNGDPFYSDARPRTNLDGYGMITDVCIKSKLRRALIGLGQNILIQPEKEAIDGFHSIKQRFEAYQPLKDCLSNKDAEPAEVVRLVCENWFDTRAFGSLITYKGKSSIGIKGAVTINTAMSVSKVDVTELSITKSANMDSKKNAEGVDIEGMSSDRIGLKCQVPFGLYVICGSISPFQAEKNGLTQKDVELLKKAFLNMFDDDASAARPAGSMEVERMYWWDHSKGGEGKLPKVSAKTIFDSVKIESAKGPDEAATSMADYTISNITYKGVVEPEIFSRSAIEMQ